MVGPYAWREGVGGGTGMRGGMDLAVAQLLPAPAPQLPAPSHPAPHLDNRRHERGALLRAADVAGAARDLEPLRAQRRHRLVYVGLLPAGRVAGDGWYAGRPGSCNPLHPGPAPAASPWLPRPRRCPTRAPGADEHRSALLAQPPCDAEADARRRRGDERHLAAGGGRGRALRGSSGSGTQQRAAARSSGAPRGARAHPGPRPPAGRTLPFSRLQRKSMAGSAAAGSLLGRCGGRRRAREGEGEVRSGRSAAYGGGAVVRGMSEAVGPH
jgi:hypothetical protein